MPITYKLIGSTTTNNTSIVTFSNIPATYTDLELHVIAGEGSSSADLTSGYFYINSDNASTTYSTQRWTFLNGGGNAGHSPTDSSFNPWYLPTSYNYPSLYAGWKIMFPSYAETTFRKIMLLHGGCMQRYSNGSTGQVMTGFWNNTAAITSLTFRNFNAPTLNFKNNSIFSLYGILRA